MFRLSRRTAKSALLLLAFTVLLTPTSSYVVKSVDASTDSFVEAIAVVEVVSGVTNTYNVGLSFTNNNDCMLQIQQLNTMLNNLIAQGLSLGGKPIELVCAESKVIKITSNN